jgi:hypothetical protein
MNVIPETRLRIKFDIYVFNTVIYRQIHSCPIILILQKQN